MIDNKLICTGVGTGFYNLYLRICSVLTYTTIEGVDLGWKTTLVAMPVDLLYERITVLSVFHSNGSLWCAKQGEFTKEKNVLECSYIKVMCKENVEFIEYTFAAYPLKPLTRAKVYYWYMTPMNFPVSAEDGNPRKIHQDYTIIEVNDLATYEHDLRTWICP